jgi:hypothetical protein
MAISRHLPQYPHLQEDFNVAEAEDIITLEGGMGVEEDGETILYWVLLLKSV